MELWFDLYLYVFPDNNKLVKIPHLSRTDAIKYARQWLDMNDLHDYVLVLEDDTPWGVEKPDITVETPEWITSEYNKLIRD